jgi:PD-(D/E)XK nuclease superfamily
MRRGKAIHSAIEARIKTGSGPGSPEADAALTWLREHTNAPLLSEKVFGIVPMTGKVYTADHRDNVASTDVPVIVDLIVGNAETWDFKTGSQFSTFSYEPQVRLTAYAVATWIGVDEFVTGLAYVSPTGVATKSWDLDAFDFADQKRKLRMWAEQAPTAKPNPGTACKYCPARTICPEQTPAAHR